MTRTRRFLPVLILILLESASSAALVHSPGKWCPAHSGGTEHVCAAIPAIRSNISHSPSPGRACFSPYYGNLTVFYRERSTSPHAIVTQQAAPNQKPDKNRISEQHAVSLALRYLKVSNRTKFTVTVSVAVITSDTYNTYKRLAEGTHRPAWVVTLSEPDAVGSSKTVYVDKNDGSILGGYTSK